MELRMRYLWVVLVLFIGLPFPLMAGSGVLHQGNWDFYFGNHIDWHQEARVKNDGTLKGRLYILPIPGKFTSDGEQVYRHPRGPSQNEECGVTTFECIVGWNFTAYPIRATFLYHQGVNGDDHPVWMLNRVDILQPSASSHFHWIANQGPLGTSDTRAVSTECDKNNASSLESQAPVATGKTCEGWVIALRAVRDFAFEHGGEIVTIHAGIDFASHLNVVTNYQAVSEVIPPTH